MRLATLLALLLAAAPALAQTPGNCQLGTAEADLNIGDVQARLFNTGSLFFGNTTVNGDGYIAPKFSGNSPIFAAGIWIGGTVGGDLRVAGATYADFEFWPGPLNPDASLPNPDDCSAFDRIWTVSVFDLNLYDDEGVATPDLAEWPVDLGAPVIDGDGVVGNYNLEGGDRPEVYGHQTAFWAMNDVGNVHTNNLTPPIGLEVRVTAFATAEEPLERHTFYRYELVNRNSQPFEAARFGLFVDPDLGDAADDFIGSDSTRNMAFVYNGEEVDANYGTPPATGYDFLTGAGVSTYFNGSSGPTADPSGGEDYYNHLRGLWRDGTPFTEGGDGYMTDGPVLTWAFPGDPVTGAFWSEVNPDGDGDPNPVGDRRNVITTEAFTLAPGASRTIDIALLFAQGDDRFDSVAELQNISDAVQARYDAGELFAPSPVPFPPVGTLPTPALVSPPDGSLFVDALVPLDWTPVAGADGYRIEVAADPDFATRHVFYDQEPPFNFSDDTRNEVLDYYWRVQAGDGLDVSEYSDVRTFTLYRYGFDDFGDGVGIVEVAHPDAEVCPPDSDDPGCAAYDGNTVWQNPNSTGDYVLANEDNDLRSLVQYAAVTDSDLELRFTEDCAEPGACLGVYASAIPGGDDLITSVPFELWNAGLAADESDDVRMIPILRSLGDGPSAQWADTFPVEQEVIAGEDTLMLPVTHRVLGFMPDRPNGYAFFEAAAGSFGGPGATYDPEADSDDEIDINPINGEECRRQNYYVDFCYRGASSLAVALLGGLDGFVLADLAGDGTTPPAGTAIRFDAPERILEVSAEGDGPLAQPQALTLDAAYPNPFRASATVTYRLGAASDVRLAVYDVLGRRVAVLAKGRAAAGEHRATFDGAGLASGVYLVVLETDGQRATQKVLLLR